MADDHEVMVFSRGLKKGLSHGETYQTKQDGVDVTRVFVDLRKISEFRDIYMKPWLDKLFREYIESEKPDVVHFQHLGGMSLGMLAVAAEFGVPVVMTLSDHQPYCPRGQRIRNDKRVCKSINLDECLECLMPQTVGLPGKTSKLVSYLLGKQKGKQILRTMHEDIKEAFRNVDCFVMPSDYHRNRMIEMGVPEDTSLVLPYGLDLSLLDSVKPREAGVPVRRFGYLGTLIPSKGIEDAIMAFKRIKTPECSLHVYGEAVPYHGITDYDKRLAELGRSADISFYGPYQPEDLPRVLENIDALIMPSRWYESYGITIREAFRARRPVIASDIGGFTEAIEHMKNGLKFPVGDVFGLAEQMDILAADPELAARLSEEGGHTESLSDHAAKLMSVYEGGCGGGA